MPVYRQKYHNFWLVTAIHSHTITGRIPTEVLLGRSPCTKQSLVQPCLSDHLTPIAEASVGDKQLGQIVINQQVAVRNF